MQRIWLTWEKNWRTLTFYPLNWSTLYYKSEDKWICHRIAHTWIHDWRFLSKFKFIYVFIQMTFAILLLRVESIPLIYLCIFHILGRVIFKYMIQARVPLGESEMQPCWPPRPRERLHEEEGTKVPKSQVSSRHKRMSHSPRVPKSRNEFLQLRKCCKAKFYF